MRHPDCDELNMYSSYIYVLPKMSRRDEWKRVFTFSHSKQGAFAYDSDVGKAGICQSMNGLLDWLSICLTVETPIMHCKND